MTHIRATLALIAPKIGYENVSRLSSLQNEPPVSFETNQTQTMKAGAFAPAPSARALGDLLLYQPLRPGRALPGRSGEISPSLYRPPAPHVRDALREQIYRTMPSANWGANRQEHPMTEHNPSPVQNSDKDRVFIFDTTLRDGEQCPGASMTFEEKLEVADMLDALGVDIIEAGFPIASQGDFESVVEIARRVKNASSPGCRAPRPRTSTAAPKRCDHAAHRRASTPSSPPRRCICNQVANDAGKGAGADRIDRSPARATMSRFVEWSAEDGTRTEHDFLCRSVEAAINAGATTINIPDTVGYTTPDEYRALFEMVRARVPNADKAIFSVHCHDDLGWRWPIPSPACAGGARQIECTINGIGERAGNAALEEIVMAIRTRADTLPFTIASTRSC